VWIEPGGKMPAFVVIAASEEIAVRQEVLGISLPAMMVTV
jgi:hypothetical protein